MVVSRTYNVFYDGDTLYNIVNK